MYSVFSPILNLLGSLRTFLLCVRCLIKASHNSPVWPSGWHQITSLLTRSITQQCAGHWHHRAPETFSETRLTMNISPDTKTFVSVLIFHWITTTLWSLVIFSKCHYSPGWAATLRLEEITKRLLGARFTPGRHCTKETQTPGDVSCVTTTWVLSSAQCALPAAEPGLRLVTVRLPWATAHQHQPQPQNPTWNSRSSLLKKWFCLWTIIKFPSCCELFCHFLQVFSY